RREGSYRAITLDELVLVPPRSSTCSSTGTLGALAQTKPHEQERGPQAPFSLLTSTRHHSGRRLISTRRFCARPSGVLLLAIGWLGPRSEEHTSELQSRENLVCRLLLEK